MTGSERTYDAEVAGKGYWSRTRIIWDPTLFLTKNLFGPQIHLRIEFDPDVGKTFFIESCKLSYEKTLSL